MKYFNSHSTQFHNVHFHFVVYCWGKLHLTYKINIFLIQYTSWNNILRYKSSRTMSNTIHKTKPYPCVKVQ